MLPTEYIKPAVVTKPVEGQQCRVQRAANTVLVKIQLRIRQENECKERIEHKKKPTRKNIDVLIWTSDTFAKCVLMDVLDANLRLGFCKPSVFTCWRNRFCDRRWRNNYKKKKYKYVVSPVHNRGVLVTPCFREAMLNLCM